MSSNPNYDLLETLYVLGEFDKVVTMGKEFLASTSNDSNQEVFLLIQTMILISYSSGYHPDSEVVFLFPFYCIELD
jgi:hypothetical protein